MIKVFIILIYVVIYFIIGLVYENDMIGSDIYPKLILYFAIMSILSFIYPKLFINNNINNNKNKKFSIKHYFYNYITLLGISNFTNIYLMIVYAFPDWGVDYEGLAVGFIYFIISIIITFIFYNLGLVFLTMIFKIINKNKN